MDINFLVSRVVKEERTVRLVPSGTCDFATNPDEDFKDDGDRFTLYGFVSSHPNPYHRLLNELTVMIVPVLPSIYLSLWKQFPEDLFEYIDDGCQPSLRTFQVAEPDPYEVVLDLRFYDSDIWFHSLSEDEIMQFGYTIKQLNDFELTQRRLEEDCDLSSGSVICKVESNFVEPEALIPFDSPNDIVGDQDTARCNYIEPMELCCLDPTGTSQIIRSLKMRSYCRYSAWTQLLFIYCGRPPNFQNQEKCMPEGKQALLSCRGTH